MNEYQIEVVVRYNFTVEADTPDKAYQEAQDWDEYWSMATVERIQISQENKTITTH